MKKSDYFILAGVFFLSTIVFWGCNGARPSAPATMSTLTVKVPANSGKRAMAAVAASDVILYRVNGPNMFPVSGVIGTIPDSSISSGAYTFSINVPTGTQRVLSLQVNDAATSKPIALGASEFDLGTQNTATDVTVELGSLTKVCYTQTVPSYTISYYYSYSFNTGTYNSGSYIGPGNDIQILYDGYNGGFYFSDASSGYSNTIAYMGNGSLVDYAYVPSGDHFSWTSYQSKSDQLFQPTPTPDPTFIPGVKKPALLPNVSAPNIIKDLQAGDIYCIAISSIPGGHAWVQVTDGGLATPDINPPYYIVNTSPSFIFRTNSTKTFYEFEQTFQDTQGGCP